MKQKEKKRKKIENGLVDQHHVLPDKDAALLLSHAHLVIFTRMFKTNTLTRNFRALHSIF
jgi:hypothetical protein